jgi:hypothetical protein
VCPIGGRKSVGLSDAALQVRLHALGRSQAEEPVVRVRVETDGVSSREDLLHEPRMRLGLPRDDEERGLRVHGVERVENARRRRGVRPIVERERVAACALGPADDRVDEHPQA